jgi:hypothetical protein
MVAEDLVLVGIAVHPLHTNLTMLDNLDRVDHHLLMRCLFNHLIQSIILTIINLRAHTSHDLLNRVQV